MPDVKGVADLALLAVANAVDPGFHLFGDNIAHRAGETGRKTHLVDALANLLRHDLAQQLRRARQTADMRRQDAVGARLHLARSLP